MGGKSSPHPRPGKPPPRPHALARAIASPMPDLTDHAPLTVAGFQALIRDRYLATDAARGTPATFMWFIEEVGELATALQQNAPGRNPTPEQRANLAEEFADVLAWLMTLANVNGVDVAQALSKYTDPSRVEGVKE